VSVVRGLFNFVSSWIDVLRVQVHVATVLVRFPTLMVQRPSVWRFDRIGALSFGQRVLVGPFTEIIVYARNARSLVAGQLTVGDDVVIGAGCNIRAAGGAISIGDASMLAQSVRLIAANHTVAFGATYRDLDWDSNKTGVTIGRNCWIGADCTILPGVVIGDNCVISAGAVVTKSVPPNEIWAGVPARRLKSIE